MPALADEQLMKHLMWSRTAAMTPQRFRTILDSVRLYVDCDGTLFDGWATLRPSILGVPTIEFLTREPYILQTWRGCDWDEFIRKVFGELYPTLPPPEAVICPSAFRFSVESGAWKIGKDFSALGLTNKIIVDDLRPHEIRAPGCVVIHVNCRSQKMPRL